MEIQHITTFYTGNQKFDSVDELKTFLKSLSYFRDWLSMVETLRPLILSGKLENTKPFELTLLDESTILFSLVSNEQAEQQIISMFQAISLYPDDFNNGTDTPPHRLYYDLLGWKVKRQKYVDGVLVNEVYFGCVD